jgi:hypothetical protein
MTTSVIDTVIDTTSDTGLPRQQMGSIFTSASLGTLKDGYSNFVRGTPPSHHVNVQDYLGARIQVPVDLKLPRQPFPDKFREENKFSTTSAGTRRPLSRRKCFPTSM